MLAAITKCIFVGLTVGFAWVPLCFLASLFFYGLRDAGIFLLLLLIPVGALCTWWVTKKYLLQETNRFRGAIALGARYFFLGAALGFFLAGCACDVCSTTFLGGAIGAMVGSLGGAFQGWLWPRTPAVPRASGTA
jgi:hypothetical protein